MGETNNNDNRMTALFDENVIHFPEHNTLRFRPLSHDDIMIGNVLSQLTVAELDSHTFTSVFEKLKENGDHYIIVAEDHQTAKILACGTLLIEQKFIHNGGKVGHIEDIVVDEIA